MDFPTCSSPEPLLDVGNQICEKSKKTNRIWIANIKRVFLAFCFFANITVAYIIILKIIHWHSFLRFSKLRIFYRNSIPYSEALQSFQCSVFESMYTAVRLFVSQDLLYQLLAVYLEKFTFLKMRLMRISTSQGGCDDSMDKSWREPNAWYGID